MKQVVNYSGKEESFEVVSKDFETNIIPNSNKIWNGETLIVPDVIPSSRRSIIKISYILSIHIKINGFLLSKKTQFPVTIGTIPIRDQLVDNN